MSSGDSPDATLGKRVSGALKWSFANSALTRVAQVGLSIVLARLIAPSEFGVYAAALVVINIILSISELGVGVALVRHQGPIDKMAPTVASLAIASSAALAGLCMLGAPAFATALGSPEATGVIRLMSVAVFVAGFAAVPGAILQRNFRQDHKMAADQISFVLSTATVIGLALAGFGPWALGWSRVVGNASAAGVMTYLTKERYRPGFDRVQAREVLNFGLPLAASSLLVFAVMNIDYVVVGSLIGQVELGYYLIAFNLSSWPVNAFSTTIRSVSVAGFAQLRHDPNLFRQAFPRALRLLMALTVPACGLLAVFAAPLVGFAYGSRWMPSAAALAVLAALGAARVALELAYDYLASAGRSRAILLIHLFWLVALLPALAVGANVGGIAGVAWGHVAVVALGVGPVYLFTLRANGIQPADLMRAVARPLGAGAVMVLVAMVVQSVVSSDLVVLFVGGPLALLAYGAVLWPARDSLRGSSEVGEVPVAVGAAT